MSQPEDKSAEQTPALESTTVEPSIKSQRGAYLGPKGPPVEMTPETFVNPTPTTDQGSPSGGDAAKE